MCVEVVIWPMEQAGNEARHRCPRLLRSSLHRVVVEAFILADEV
jgi:hypothetical protein